MGERTDHAPGTFSWAELATSDVGAAKGFYSALLGWEYEDNEIPGGGIYSMASHGGGHVAALVPAQEGFPTAWLSYVTVAGADAAAAAVGDHGGAVIMEPFDVMEAGRMTVVQDPAGALLALWEPRDSIGAERVNEPGALTLNQLNTTDLEGARAFYSGVLGWRFEDVGTAAMPYWGIYNADRLNGGMMPLPAEAGAPPHWLAYFGSGDIDADAGRIAELGGRVMVEPMGVPGGRILVAADPQGAVFALLSGRFDD